jgi:hypothetical protein
MRVIPGPLKKTAVSDVIETVLRASVLGIYEPKPKTTTIQKSVMAEKSCLELMLIDKARTSHNGVRQGE